MNIPDLLAELAKKKADRDQTLYFQGAPQPVASVPCGKCRECCKHGAVIMMTNHDDWESYETEIDEGEDLGGMKVRALKHKPNGDCIYLGDNGCTIHDRAPHICRTFDCRLAYLRYKDDPRFRDVMKTTTGIEGKRMLKEHPVKLG